MDKYLTKDQVKVMLQNAPKNTTPDGIVNSLVAQGYKLEGLNDQPVEKKPNLINRIKEDITNRGENVVSEIQNTNQNPLLSGINATAEGFKGITDVAGQVIKTIPGGRSALDFLGDKIGAGFNKVVDKVSDTPLIKEAAMSGETQGLENTLKGVSSAGEIAGIIDGVQGATSTFSAGVKGVKNLSKKGIKVIDDLSKRSEAQIESSVLSNYQKGVKPTIVGQKTLGNADTYKKNVIDAINSIKDNAPNLKFTDDIGEAITGQTPKTLQQLAESVDQTKKSIFTKYDDLAKQAGEAGVSVDIKPIASELDSVINNKALSVTNPKAIDYATQLKDRLNSTGTLDASTAQEVVQNYNKSLEAFYRNPSYETASQAAVDAMIANKIRTTLDESISSLTGKSYSGLKKQYGALKSIEKDVVKAALRDARKNTKGLIDFTDILSGGQVVDGILSLSPGRVASGLVQKGIAEFYKYINNPNRAIEKMFNQVNVK